jgi:hypothetical protein
VRKIAIAATTALLTGIGLVTATSGAAVAAPVAGRAAAACHLRWDKGAKHAGVMVQSQVRAVRAGQHPCFDRLVIDIGKGDKPGYRVRYVRQIVQDPSGNVIPVRGHAKLLITVMAPAAPSFPANSHHLADVAGFASFRQIVGAGSFEGLTSIGAGIRVKLPFRVFEVRDPGYKTRLVVDVAHHR